MPAKRLPMRLLREILRLRYAGGLSQRAIARCLSIGLGTVCECLARAARAGLTWPLPAEFDDARLEAVLATRPRQGAPPSRPLPDLARLHEELRRPGVTLQRKRSRSGVIDSSVDGGA